MKRKPLSKRVRFSIFARDEFTCRYCGRQSDEVKLVVDHLIPVSQGGTNEQENLITSCEECNQGKAAKTIEEIVPAKHDRFAELQKYREQLDEAKMAAEIIGIREQLHENLAKLISQCTGDDYVDKRTLSILTHFVRLYGWMKVADWVAIAKDRVRTVSDYNICKYVCGIRKRQVERGECETVEKT